MLRDHGARQPDQAAESTEASIEELLEASRRVRKRRRRETDLLGGDGDLVGLLVGLLADEPHHLLDLLGYIGVIHVGGGGSDGPSGCSARSGDRRAGVDGSAGAGAGRQPGVHGIGNGRGGGRGASLAAGAT